MRLQGVASRDNNGTVDILQHYTLLLDLELHITFKKKMQALVH
jgi:hypothetical protein